jgi:O-antigen/teichoic acid export membrane protein
MNLILIPRIGISGAALANCSAYAVLAVVTTIWAWKTLSFRFNLMYLGKVAAASAAVWLGLSFWPISGITGLVLGISTGSAIYVIALLLLRAFSEQDKQLVRGLLGNFIPSLLKRGPKRL